MEMNIFKTVPLEKVSFFQKLFKQYPEENAVIELNNLFAKMPIRQVSKEQIVDIEDRYKINLGKEFKLNLEEFYAVFLNHCLKDMSLSTDELEDLKYLKHLLSLDDKSIENLHNRIGEIVYRKSFEEAVADGRLTNKEVDFLNKLETDLRLPKQLAEKISSEVKSNYIQSYVNNIISEQRLSPNEELELQAIASNLDVSVELNSQTQAQLKRLKLFWALENLPLPSIQVDIIIQKSEECYFHIGNVNWFELRSVRQRVSYTGFTTSFKIAKGFYLRSGSFQPRSFSVDQMTLVDNGDVYLTNKRLIFVGAKKNSNIRYEKILNITPYSDGVEIDKETGKSPMLQLPMHADIFCMTLERLIRER
ncbi:MAG: hypothetical protein JNL95_03920 [Chitinophagales bacterium]|nr:hypothetical protein [Chitinophagales bacterium]